MGEETKQQPEQPMAEEKKGEKAEEEKKEDKAEERKEEEVAKKQPQPPSSSPFVLLVELHCMGCAKKIERSILKIRGVEGVVMDMAQNHVTVKGLVEPRVVCATIEKKTRRPARLLSPQGEPIPQVVASQVSGLTTVELNVNMHCEACSDQLKRQILKMKGVRTVETELNSGKVTVTGTMDSNRLVDYVYRRTKKQAQVVPPEKSKDQEAEPPEPNDAVKPADSSEEPKPEDSKDELENKQVDDPSSKKEEEGKQDDGSNKRDGGGDEESMMMMVSGDSMNENQQPSRQQAMMHYYQPVYVIERIPPPQLFSDENPNACCIS